MLTSTQNTLARRTVIAARDAATVRALAGSPHSRRGSVLVLVVGVLALLAIVVVVYTSVGQADARGGRAIVSKARLDDQSKAIGDHIAGIVGADATAVRVKRVLVGNTPSFYSERETMDYPRTDPAARSNITLAGIAQPDLQRFDAVGNITRAWTGTGDDPRVTSDAWLASTESSWVNNGTTNLPGMPDPFVLLGKQRDWAHLTMISPSGMPVNLANLRGNFAARPGFDTNNPYNPGGAPSISDHLYLMDRSGGSIDARFAATPQLDVQVGNIDLYNSPATWTNDRLESFRPITWNPNALSAGDVKYLGNVMADADGDGWYDSLWQELVDASDPSSPINLLQGGTGVRWFVAPRIVDLSGLVNVNVASSLAVPPSIEHPAGFTPADIDLERLLTMADARQYFGVNPASDFYTESGSPFAGASDAQFMAAGRSAFAGIFEGRLTGLAEVTPIPANPFEYGPAIYHPQWAQEMGTRPPSGLTVPASPFGAAGTMLGAVTRAELYTYGGKEELAGRLRTDAAVSNPGSADFYLKQPTGYGTGDERDLRARGFTNDDSTLSRLEAVAGANNNANISSLNPLRSTRSGLIDREAGLTETVSRNGETLPRSMTQYAVDVRRLLTTLSGARPIGYNHVRLANQNDSGARSISQSEVRVDVNALIERATSLNSTTARYPLPAANEIFRTYALALAPFLDDPAAWNSVTTTKRAVATAYGALEYNVQTDPLNAAYGETINPDFSGRPAEIATRMAAHMALNLMAWQDGTRTGVAANAQPDGRPLAATLLLDDTRRANMTSDVWAGAVRRFPYWDPSVGSTRMAVNNNTLPGNLVGTSNVDPKAFTFDLNMGVPAGGTNPQGLLAGGAGNQYTTGYALNLYAAQPQPFITAACSFTMYYDAPLGSGGDSRGTGPGDGEWYISNPGDPGMGIPPTIQSNGVSINGTVNLANPDFVMECVAFQLTNPFDVPITLPLSTYYFEFARRYYTVADYGTGTTATAVTLAPREARTFYVLSQDPASLSTRWQQADGRISPTDLTTWLNKQLRALLPSAKDPARMLPYNPQTNTATPGFHNIFNSDNATQPSFKSVLLWRTVRQNGAETAVTNNLNNDYLVDRLRDPSIDNAGTDAALYRRLPSGQNIFSSVPAGPEPGEPEFAFYVGQNANDSLGYAITFFGEIRRRSDPAGGPLPIDTGTPDTFAGVMPAWCLEPRIGGTFVSDVNNRNVTGSNTGIPSTGSAVTAVNTGSFTGETFAGDSFFQMYRNAINSASFTSAAVHPSTRNAANDAANTIGNDLASVSWQAGNKATQLPVYPRRSSNLAVNEAERPPLRPADLLLPWAIGPWQDPTNLDVELRHTTLSEAMAMALNYVTSSNTASFESRLGRALDRCRLKLDRYVPFNDNGNGVWDYTGTAPDPLISNGVPYALNVIDAFRTTRYGSFDSAAFGRVNINTAPFNVLRVLPLVTPPSPNISGTDGNAFADHWMNSTTGAFRLRLRDESGNLSDRALWRDSNERWDAAAAIMAYRDKTAVIARGPKDNEQNGRVYVDFSGGKAGVRANDGQTPNQTTFRGGRRFLTNVVNQREELGFQSPAEVMMAYVQDNSVRSGVTLNNDNLKQLGTNRFNSTELNGANQAQPSNFITTVEPIQNTTAINRTGAQFQREQALGLTAQASLRQSAQPAEGMAFVHGGTSADYDRKLAMANALLNTISTSSDFYCAYFVVNGYTEADVQGLEPWTGNGAAPAEERYSRPMIPSIQRRFMMVLDRSQCTRPGDKPKILMFQELPVR